MRSRLQQDSAVSKTWLAISYDNRIRHGNASLADMRKRGIVVRSHVPGFSHYSSLDTAAVTGSSGSHGSCLGDVAFLCMVEYWLVIAIELVDANACRAWIVALVEGTDAGLTFVMNGFLVLE